MAASAPPGSDSSAGWKTSRTRPGRSPASASARAVPSRMAVWASWPHAWQTPAHRRPVRHVLGVVHGQGVDVGPQGDGARVPHRCRRPARCRRAGQWAPARRPPARADGRPWSRLGEAELGRGGAVAAAQPTPSAGVRRQPGVEPGAGRPTQGGSVMAAPTRISRAGRRPRPEVAVVLGRHPPLALVARPLLDDAADDGQLVGAAQAPRRGISSSTRSPSASRTGCTVPVRRRRSRRRGRSGRPATCSRGRPSSRRGQLVAAVELGVHLLDQALGDGGDGRDLVEGGQPVADAQLDRAEVGVRAGCPTTPRGRSGWPWSRSAAPCTARTRPTPRAGRAGRRSAAPRRPCERYDARPVSLPIQYGLDADSASRCGM